MAAKKTAAVKQVRKARVQTQVVSITPEQFTAGVEGIKRAFETLYRIEKAVVGKDNTYPEPNYAQTQAESPYVQAESRTVSVYETIDEVNQLAMDTRNTAAGIREKVRGESGNLKAENQSECAPSQGMAKDVLESIRQCLYSINRDLCAIAMYTLA